MCKCNGKTNTCEDLVFASCVKFEGELPDFSQYKNNCTVTVEDAIEELYNLSTEGIEYFAGQGLSLNTSTNTFSVNFGTTSQTVKPGNWLPDWDDVQNKPNIVEPKELIAGDNITLNETGSSITINATFPTFEGIDTVFIGSTQQPTPNNTLTIPLATTSGPGVIRVGSNLTVTSNGELNALPPGQVNVIETVRINGGALTPIGKAVNIPPATTSSLGVVSVGTNLTVDANGRISAPATGDYNVIENIQVNGTNLTPVSKTVNIPIFTTSLDGLVPRRVGSTTTRFLREDGTWQVPTGSGATYPTGTSNDLQQGISSVGMVWSPQVINNWYDNNRLSLTSPGASTAILDGTVTLSAGTGMTISQVGKTFTFSATGGGGTPFRLMANAAGVWLTGDVRLLAGTDISLGQSGNDITINSTVKPSQTIVIPTGNYAVVLGGVVNTNIFIDNSTASIITLPNGEFDGQVVSIYLSDPTRDDVTAAGDLTLWRAPVANVSSVVISNESAEHFCWSSLSSRWIVGKHN